MAFVVFVAGIVGVTLGAFGLSQFWLTVAILAAYQAYQAAAWVIVAGYAGQLSIANPVFVAVGGYVSVYLFLNLGLSPWIGMWLGALLAGILAAFVGWLFFRAKASGMAFALGTFAVSQVALWFIIGSESLGARDGFIVTQTLSPLHFQFPTRYGFYFAIWSMLGLLLLGAWRLKRSRMGYYLLAIREDPEAAEALGINLLRYKTAALIVSGMAGAIGGTFLGQFLLFISPELFLAPRAILIPIIAAFFGGIRTVGGAAVGALILVPIGEWLRTEYGSSLPGIDLVIYGVILVVVIRLLPDGIMGGFRTVLARAGG